MPNALYYGDNLEILREHIPDESVDLIYLDPPFNSQATYNVLFRPRPASSRKLRSRPSRIHGTGTPAAEQAFDEVMQSGNTDAAEMLRAMRSFLKENDVMAYLTMMAVRLLELHRVLKTTGSLYLHCDPTASHYLKILLDAIFGPINFVNEIVWKQIQCSQRHRQGSQILRQQCTIHLAIYSQVAMTSTWNQPYHGSARIHRAKVLHVKIQTGGDILTR